MIQLVYYNNLQFRCETDWFISFSKPTLVQKPNPFHTQTHKTKQGTAEEQQASSKNTTQLHTRIPVLPSFVHVFMLLHHDRVSCWDINDDPDRKEIMASLLKGHTNYSSIIRKRMLKLARVWMHEGVSYCAVLVRMDVRRACSSVRAEGTLVVIQSVPFGGLLTGFGWGISGLRSSGS